MMRSLLVLVAFEVHFLLGELQGPNICISTKSNHIILYVTEKPYQLRGCHDNNPDCVENRVENDPIIKEQHQFRNEEVKECCAGYVENEAGTGCVPSCSEPCENGKCVAPDSCLEDCPDGYWGVYCENRCNCTGDAYCDQLFGTCLCSDGEDCQKKCPVGVYEYLPCLFGEWDCTTGLCICYPGRFGVLCNETCPMGTYGYQCNSTCTCQNNATCNLVNGKCSCTQGWMGLNCTEPCPTGTWGENCASPCYCHNGGFCHHVDGTCTCKPGFVGRNCEVTCLSGRIVDGKCKCPHNHTGVDCIEDSLLAKPFYISQKFLVTSAAGVAVFLAVLTLLIVGYCIRKTRTVTLDSDYTKIDPFCDRLTRKNAFFPNPLYSIIQSDTSLNCSAYNNDECINLTENMYSKIEENNQESLTEYEQLERMKPIKLLSPHYSNRRVPTN